MQVQGAHRTVGQLRPGERCTGHCIVNGHAARGAHEQPSLMHLKSEPLTAPRDGLCEGLKYPCDGIHPRHTSDRDTVHRSDGATQVECSRFEGHGMHLALHIGLERPNRTGAHLNGCHTSALLPSDQRDTQHMKVVSYCAQSEGNTVDQRKASQYRPALAMYCSKVITHSIAWHHWQ